MVFVLGAEQCSPQQNQSLYKRMTTWRPNFRAVVWMSIFGASLAFWGMILFLIPELWFILFLTSSIVFVSSIVSSINGGRNR